ncbi:MAG: hypothetical protein ACI4TZ_00670 [Christensenellales bacterium]
MTKSNKIGKVLISFLAVLFCSVFFCGCVIQGSIEKYVTVTVEGKELTKADNYKTGITVSAGTKDENNNIVYTISIKGNVNNTSQTNFNYYSLKFAVYDGDKKLITTIEKSIGKLGHAGSTAQDDTDSSSKDFEFSKAIKSKSQYRTDGAYAVLTYSSGWAV